jgi:RNA polymerase sigma factor (sigma-70 family)
MPESIQLRDFARWWVELEPELLRAARKYGSSVSDPDDVVQDLAVLAVKQHRRFSEKEDFRRWAFARIHWLLLDRLRSRRGISMELLPDVALPSGPNQEKEVVADEILELVKSLPKRQLRVIWRTIQGYPVDAIANEMGISEATVRSLRRFGRSHLATRLAKKDLKQ